MDDDAINAAFAGLDAEEAAGESDPAQLADEPQDGDADEAPEQGDEAETADEADKAEAADAAPFLDMAAPVKVKVNGEEIEVPLEEALKGYSRLEDYKAKTAELAEQGRALHGELAERLQTALETFVQADPVLAEAAKIDWVALSEEDPAHAVKLQAQIQQRQSIIAATQAKINEARAVEAQATAEREYRLLVKADPSLADADTYDKRIGSLRDYLTSKHGFSPAELDAINSHKYVLIAEKAAAYDRLMSAKKELPAKTVPPPKPQAKSLTTGSTAPPRTSPRPPANASQAAWKAWFDKTA